MLNFTVVFFPIASIERVKGIFSQDLKYIRLYEFHVTQHDKKLHKLLQVHKSYGSVLYQTALWKQGLSEISEHKGQNHWGTTPWNPTGNRDSLCSSWQGHEHLDQHFPWLFNSRMSFIWCEKLFIFSDLELLLFII